jgi:lipid-binding SYLF domain-containing protein
MKSASTFLSSSILAVIAITGLSACDTAPKTEDRVAFTQEAQTSRALFLSQVTGLQAQLDKSAGYAVFPGVGQWGLLFGGGQFGRGAVFTPSGTQEAWAALSNPTVGLQIGGQGLQLLIVFETAARFDEFKKNVLAGSAGGTAVGGDAGTAAVAAYDHGVAVYITGQKGLMAGASVGLQYLRYMSLADAIAADKK